MLLSFINGGIFSEQKILPSLYLSGTYCDKTGTKNPGFVTLQQPTIYAHIKIEEERDKITS